MAKLRAAVITDVHYGVDIKDKLGSRAPRLMEHFVKAVNKYAPDFVVDIGDRVSAISPDSDRTFMKSYRDHFNDVAAPLHCVHGNHDLRHLSRAENAAITGSPGESYSRDEGDYHFVFWNPHYVFGKNGIEVKDDDIEWLRRDLAAAKGRPAVVFSHVPLDNLEGEERAEVTKFYFWTQGDDIRKVMEDAGNVVLCMHGHRHRNQHREINGIHYVTQQSFTSVWKDHYRIPSRTFSFLELDDGKITITLNGKTRKTYELDMRPVI